MTRRPVRRVTQADVARLAGVSQATVSHVLTGGSAARSRVGEDARRRVQEAVKITGYVADAVAQSLAGGRNQIIGVFTYESVFPREGDDFYYPFLVGIEREAESLGCDLLLLTSAPVRGGRRRLLSDGARRIGIADGCLLLGQHDDKRDLAELLARGFPFAFVGRRESDAGRVPYAAADYAKATREVVDMLFRHGHEHIGYVGELSDRESTADRLAGYRAAMGSAGRRPVTLDGQGLEDDAALDLVLQNRLTAAVVAPGVSAAGLRQAALARGLDVPGDLSIARLGDPISRGEIDDVDWTGFHIPREEIGAEALRVLAAVISEDDAGELQRTLACTVLPGSTAGSPTGDGGARGATR